MRITTLTSRAFNQDVSKAKRDAAMGPVFITDRGPDSACLLTIEDYLRITKTEESIVNYWLCRKPWESILSRPAWTAKWGERRTYPDVSARHQCHCRIEKSEVAQSQS